MYDDQEVDEEAEDWEGGASPRLADGDPDLEAYLAQLDELGVETAVIPIDPLPCLGFL
jgi:hypothetical protein